MILNVILPLLPSCWGFSFALGSEVSFFLVVSNILLSMAIQQQVAILEFSQEKTSTRPSTLLSWEVRTLLGVDLTEAEDINKRW